MSIQNYLVHLSLFPCLILIPQMIDSNSNSNYSALLEKFNKRDAIAFGEIYTYFHREMSLYIRMLYRGTEIVSDDVLHDIFMSLWSSKTIFESLQHIKSYIYLSIKNNFRNYLAHNNCKNTYNDSIRDEEMYDLAIVESELYSVVDEALKLLPETYATVLKMYLNGWKTGEIARFMDRTEQNIYNIKYESITILKKKMSQKKLFFLFSILP